MHVFYYCKHFHILQNLFQTVLINETRLHPGSFSTVAVRRDAAGSDPIDDRQYSSISLTLPTCSSFFLNSR